MKTRVFVTILILVVALSAVTLPASAARKVPTPTPVPPTPTPVPPTPTSQPYPPPGGEMVGSSVVAPTPVADPPVIPENPESTDGFSYREVPDRTHFYYFVGSDYRRLYVTCDYVTPFCNVYYEKLVFGTWQQDVLSDTVNAGWVLTETSIKPKIGYYNYNWVLIGITVESTDPNKHLPTSFKTFLPITVR